MAVDALLASRLRTALCYAGTCRRLAAGPPYLLVALLDYDLTGPATNRRVRRYLARVSEWTAPTKLDAFGRND